ncbi:transporter [Polaribacter haliotis]|uniref:Transporter n=1 Tax=Polaribacter haliotis TaxID=1888915 RepID=A0A7L8AIV6_9FLAO|nr:transporter [Polaribacter haliotis]QOD61739.1 transporter [Polaribacter haliotis]
MKKLFLCILLLSATIANAQFTETLSSDRPGQALSSNTVGKNVFQIQAGIDFSENNSEFFPNSYFRYGLSEKLELNSGIILSGNKFANEIASFSIGARYNLSDVNSKYASTLQFSHDFGATNSNSQLTYILASSLSEKLSYTVNLGINFDNNFGLNNGIYVFNLSYVINSKMGVFLEPFGNFLNNSYQFNIDSGVYYLLNNNFQIDALIGDNNGLFIGAGFTWRIPTKKI